MVRVKKSKNRMRFQCTGTDLTHENGKWVVCKENHFIGSFYAAQKIALSEGIIKEDLKTKIGSGGLVRNTGTATELLDIIVLYSGKSDTHFEVKPNHGANGAHLLKPQQRDSVIELMNHGHICYLIFYKEENFVFYHSDPIKLTMKNIEKFSQPYDQENALEKISFKKLFSDKQIEKLTVNLTGHSVKIIKKMFKQSRK